MLRSTETQATRNICCRGGRRDWCPRCGGREWPLIMRTQTQKSISKSNNSKLKVACSSENFRLKLTKCKSDFHNWQLKAIIDNGRLRIHSFQLTLSTWKLNSHTTFDVEVEGVTYVHGMQHRKSIHMVNHLDINPVQQGLTSVNRRQLVFPFGASRSRLGTN